MAKNRPTKDGRGLANAEVDWDQLGARPKVRPGSGQHRGRPQSSGQQCEETASCQDDVTPDGRRQGRGSGRQRGRGRGRGQPPDGSARGRGRTTSCSDLHITEGNGRVETKVDRSHRHVVRGGSQDARSEQNQPRRASARSLSGRGRGRTTSCHDLHTTEGNGRVEARVDRSQRHVGRGGNQDAISVNRSNAGRSNENQSRRGSARSLSGRGRGRAMSNIDFFDGRKNMNLGEKASQEQSKKISKGKENFIGKRNVRNGGVENRRQDRSYYSCYELGMLLESSASSIIEELSKRNFHRFLNDRRIHSDQANVALQLIIKVTQGNDHEVSSVDSLRILSDVMDSKLLDAGGGLEGSINHLEKLIDRQKTSFLTSFITNSLSLFRKLLTHFPNRSLKAVERLLGGIYRLSLAMARQQQMANEGAKLLPNVIEVQRLQKVTEERLDKGEQRKDDSSWLPPNDFRGISVMPTPEDLVDYEPFLKENRMNGYESALQYLDTQFRLMREDLLAPLREGIKEHKQNVVDGKYKSRLQDCSIYRDVMFLGVDTKTESSLAYVIRFNVTQLRNVQWQNTKRLMWGNLVCLSSDNFKTVYFATIVDRDARGLQKGLLSIKIEGITTVPIAQRVQSFIMIEATSYLEAYKYVLARLQTLGMELENDKDIPFQRYVVDCEPDINPPSYLDRSKTIMIPAAGDKEKKVIALSERSWSMLTPDDFNLDNSQFDALKHTLLSEMALIQGPPGTGKTFIGLKIMDILLKNKNIWKGDSEGGHIMVICFTNHALDQFLEGVLDIQGKKPSLVRIGGRCKTESLEKYILKELRYKYRFSLPQDWWNSFKAVKGDISTIGREIKEKKRLVSYQPLQLPFEWLRKFIIPRLANSFFIQGLFEEDPGMTLNAVFKRWLAGWDGFDEVSWMERIFILVIDEQGRPKDMVQQEEMIEKEHNEDVQEMEQMKHDDGSDSEGSLISVAGEAELIQSERMVDEESEKGSVVYQNYIDRVDEHENQWQKQKGKKGRWAAKPSLKDKDKNKGKSSRNMGTNKSDTQTMDTERLIDSYFEASLCRVTPMNPDKAEFIVNPWCLTQPQRFSLFLYWCDSFFQYLDVDLAYLLLDQEALAGELQCLELERNHHVIHNQDVMGLTTTGASKYTEIVQMVRPEIVIVEEAAEVLEAHVVTALTENCKHLILIGDHKQLRPNPTVYELAKDYRLNISLFERMIENNIEIKTLRLQHRMRPDIAQLLVPWIYEELIDHEVVHGYPNIKGIQSNVVFFDHDKSESGSNDSRSHSNDFEADMVVGLCKYLLQQGYKPSQITILTTYTGQMFNIRKRMLKAVFEGIRVTPVDNFQGEENDIIILSFVRSNNDRNIGFLREPNRVCVAMSRAKWGFYAFGNFSMYAGKTETWKGMVGDMQKHDLLKTSFILQCQNHPDMIAEISSADDFKKVPDGGCILPCQFELKCGHICSRKCHIEDKEHEEYKCQKPCETICKRELHKCNKRCWKPCKCTSDCPTVLACGHQCQNYCSEECTIACMDRCEKTLSCGHGCMRRCSEDCEPCLHACERKKECGHACPGKCGQACSVVPCKTLCRAVLECGHVCPKKCSVPCTPCTQKCTKGLPCGHQCKNICSGECTKKCIEPCPRDLPCGHRCRRRCGDACIEDCQKNVVKIGQCGHRILAPCSMNNEVELRRLCSKMCNRDLPCEHKCTSSCGSCTDGCRKLCSAVVQKQGSCGHRVTCRCDEDPDPKSCKKIVFDFRPCNHIVQVRCCDKGKGTCREKTDKTLPCGHVIPAECYEDVNSIKCQAVELIDPDCGHMKLAVKCCEKANFKCVKRVTRRFECGHEVKVACHKKETATCMSVCGQGQPCTHICIGICGQCRTNGKHPPCSSVCGQSLPCAHSCTGICGQCTKSANHASCRERCTESLACGHPCKGICGQCRKTKMHTPCPEICTKKQRCGHPCTLTCDHKGVCHCVSRCEAKCWHRPCRKKCNEECIPCDKPCYWRCPHFRCTKKCHETCNRGPCDESCPKKLPSCGHSCPGLCGEPCPFTCIKCHPTKFRNVQAPARYVRVQPCNHTVDVDTMDNAMRETDIGAFTVIEPKLCPVDDCGRVVLFCPRYGNTIKASTKVMRSSTEETMCLRCKRCSKVDSYKEGTRPRCKKCPR